MIMPGPLVAWALAAGGARAAFATYHAWCLTGVFCLGLRGRAGGVFLFPVWLPFVAGIAFSGVAWGLAGIGFPAGSGDGSLVTTLAGLGVSENALWWLIPYFCVVNPIIEELFWRGAVSRWVGEFGRHGRSWDGFSSLCFAVWHAVALSGLFVPWVTWSAVAVIAVLGFWAQRLRRRGVCLMELALWHGIVVDLLIAVWVIRVLTG